MGIYQKHKIIIVDDEKLSRLTISSLLNKNNYECICVENGNAGVKEATKENRPSIIIMDLRLPDIDGIKAIDLIRKSGNKTTYIIMLTASSDVKDLVRAMDAGADDFVSKPYDQHELLSRIKVGIKLIELNKKLKDHIEALEKKTKEIKRLKELLPICCQCHKIRNSSGYWQKIENYLSEYGLTFSHGYCDECYEKQMAKELANIERKSYERHMINIKEESDLSSKNVQLFFDFY